MCGVKGQKNSSPICRCCTSAVGDAAEKPRDIGSPAHSSTITSSLTLKKKKKKRINSPEELMKAKAFLCSRRVHMVKISSLLHPAGAGQIVHAPLG